MSRPLHEFLLRPVYGAPPPPEEPAVEHDIHSRCTYVAPRRTYCPTLGVAMLAMRYCQRAYNICLSVPFTRKP